MSSQTELCPTNVKCFGNCSFGPLHAAIGAGATGDLTGVGAIAADGRGAEGEGGEVSGGRLNGSFPTHDLWCTDLRERRGCWGTLRSKGQTPSCSEDCCASRT